MLHMSAIHSTLPSSAEENEVQSVKFWTTRWSNHVWWLGLIPAWSKLRRIGSCSWLTVPNVRKEIALTSLTQPSILEILLRCHLIILTAQSKKKICFMAWLWMQLIRKTLKQSLPICILLTPSGVYCARLWVITVYSWCRLANCLTRKSWPNNLRKVDIIWDSLIQSKKIGLRRIFFYKECHAKFDGIWSYMITCKSNFCERKFKHINKPK